MNNFEVKNIAELEKIIGYKFKNVNLINMALTHSSASTTFNYEKLEFLGDSLLSVIVTEFLYKYLPNKKVGELSTIRSNMVSTNSLYNIVLNSGICKFVILGESLTNNTTALKNIFADIFESVLAAIYLDGKDKQAIAFVNKFVISKFNPAVSLDFKTQLQEFIQANSNGTKISYKELEEIGPGHDLIFKIGLFLNEELKTSAVGKSKKEAEQECAKQLLVILKK